MDRPWLLVIGIVVVLLVLVDVAWTSLGAGAGRGPITRVVGRGIWRAASGTTHHRLLQATGYAILISLLLTWVLGMWLGWALIFNADDESIVKSSTQDPASILARIAYAAGAMAGAGAGFTAATDGWQLANNVAALCGLALFTLGLAYLVQAVTAASQKRATAVHINGLGADPVAIVASGAGESSLGPIGSQVTSLSTNLALVARQHQALPIVGYLHEPRPEAAIELAIAKLDEALTIIDCGLEQDHGAVTRPARLAISEYISTASVGDPDAEPPSVPDIGALEGGDVSVVAKDDFEARVADLASRRAALRSVVEANGWRWDSDVAASRR